jgi:hypothetical protein
MTIVAGVVIGGLFSLVSVFMLLWVTAPVRQRDELRVEVPKLEARVANLEMHIRGEEGLSVVIEQVGIYLTRAHQQRMAVETAKNSLPPRVAYDEMLDWKIEVLTYLRRVAPLSTARFSVDSLTNYGAADAQTTTGILREWDKRITSLSAILDELRAQARTETGAR